MRIFRLLLLMLVIWLNLHVKKFVNYKTIIQISVIFVLFIKFIIYDSVDYYILTLFFVMCLGYLSA